MGLVIVEPPNVLPVTIADARTFCRYPFDDQDTLISELIGAAVEHIEQATGRAFVQRLYAYMLRQWPGDIVRLPRSPVLSVESVSYRDRDGNIVTLAEGTDYLIDTSCEPATIEPVRSWPITGDFPDAVQISFVAGYAGDGGSPEDLTANVPARARAAVKALAAHWFEFREPVVPGTVSEVPRHVDRLINGLKVWR